MRFIFLIFLILISCTNDKENFVINKKEYKDKLEGFWLGQSIGNWTGIITEMDKIGAPVNGKGGGFYVYDDWGKKDEPNIWSNSSNYKTIDFNLAKADSIWGSDDDTDIEYMYQELILQNDNLNLRPEKIKDGWLKHIKNEEENYLWVSNQRAFDLMKKGVLPPETSSPNNNEFYEMIDAQLTTEIFGLYSPNYPDIGLRMAYMPIRTVARENAAWISEFYIIMHSLASLETDHKTIKDKLFWMSEKARYVLPNSSYSAKMHDYVKSKYESGLPWEITRDSLNYKYQINNEDGYNWSKIETNCNGCYAAGINFGASIISLFYGEGNFKETIKIATLCGWDSDNPASTWAGLLGFIYGKKEIVKMFDEELSNRYNIGRTRIGFENEIDNFESMAEKGLKIIDMVVTRKHYGEVKNNKWIFKKYPTRYTNEYVDELPEAEPPEIDLPETN